MYSFRLAVLEPEWLRCEPPDTHSWYRQDSHAGANGICFVCPKCYHLNNQQRPGCHSVICWDPSVPQSVFPGPGRWELVGDSFENLTLRAGSSSIFLTGCGAHFFITNGQVYE